ncbi:hypothetical protein VST7929_01739 [Vibrio stylophorae]|uniref:Tetratricopeptide repeat protein n=1 Tax=Vibrio stylophorae TaxID=659351 RepID=A0ABM8ZUJ6_9VIBR|nr:hypothetical protein [Vibrio stylophorae]CAH0533863.1 hypothetical protein VST7929_01739 [Vibrio stylophorae]
MKLYRLVTTLVLMSCQACASQVGDAIQQLQTGKVAQAKTILAKIEPPYQGEALFLAARVAEHDQQYQSALDYYRQYLISQPFSVHRLEARAAMTLLATHQHDAALPDYLKLIALRDQHQLEQLLKQSQQFQAQYANSPLAVEAALLSAYIRLESLNQPLQAYQSYVSIYQQARSENIQLQALNGMAYSAFRANTPQQQAQALAKMQDMLDSRWAARNPLLAKSWQARLTANQQVMEQQRNHAQLANILWGTGARLYLDHPAGSNQNYAGVWHDLKQQQLNLQSATLWITNQSDWRWLQSDRLLALEQQGLTPMIAFWYFGDKISPEYVTQNRQAYLQTLKQQLIPLLQPLSSGYLILEPEFNKNGIENWDGWDPLMLEVIALIRHELPQIQVGLALGDWDAIGSKQSYLSAQKAITASDFVASMLMISSYTERVHHQPDWSPWVRTMRLAHKLNAQFNKPWLIAYVAIASEPGWQSQQRIELEKLSFYLPYFANNHLIALNWFSLVDEPNQTGWFADAENSFGLINADYQAKPALKQFAALSAQHQRQPVSHVTMQIDEDVGQWRIQAKFSSWQPWQLLLSQSGKSWRYQGAGDMFKIDWYGQLAHGWSKDGPVEISLQVNGQLVEQRTAQWQGIPAASLAKGREKRLEPWQSLFVSLNKNEQALTKGHLYIELAINKEQRQHFALSLVDQAGYQKPLNLDIARRFDDKLVLIMPLSELAQGWRRHTPSGYLWAAQATGSLRLQLRNESGHKKTASITQVSWRP